MAARGVNRTFDLVDPSLLLCMESSGEGDVLDPSVVASAFRAKQQAPIAGVLVMMCRSRGWRRSVPVDGRARV
jgi:hypothetical protein